MSYSARINWLEVRYVSGDWQPAVAQRAIIVGGGQLQQFQDQQLSNNRKALVLVDGRLQQRATTEGSAIILKNGVLTTIAGGEYLVN